MRRVHLRTDDGYPCGVGRRWPSQDITSTRNPALVTCLRCPQPTAAEREAVDLMAELERSVAEAKAERTQPVLDIPAAWAIQHEVGELLAHLPVCSSVPGWSAISGPGLLCDCGAIVTEWERRNAALSDGEPTP